MLKPRCKNSTGSSLIELMIGIAISLVLLSGVISVMVHMSVSGGESVQGTRLNQHLRAALDLMSKDLQRAGYVDWWDAWDTDNDSTTTTVSALDDSNSDGAVDVLDFYASAIPAINVFGPITTFNVNSDASAATACSSNCNCILFSYDLNEDGAQGVASAVSAGDPQNNANRELFGYRLRDGAIETRVGGGGATNSCTDGSWEDITDEDVIEITALNFSLIYVNAVNAGDSAAYPIVDQTWTGALATTCTPGAGAVNDDVCLWRRKVNISLSGRLVSDNDVFLTLQTDVKVKNDYLQTSP